MLFAFCSTRFGWRPRCRRLIRAVIARHQSRCYICAARNGTDIDLSNGRSSKWICCAAQLLSQHWTACHGRHDPSSFELPTRLRFVAYTAVGPELIKVKPLNADTERRRMTSGAAMWAFAPSCSTCMDVLSFRALFSPLQSSHLKNYTGEHDICSHNLYIIAR